MRKRRNWLAVWTGLLVVAAGGAAGAAEQTGGAGKAAETPPGLHFSLAAQTPAPSGGAEPTFTLTIKESILLALKNNLDITIEAFNPRIREGDIATAKSAFDPVFTGSVSDGRSRTENNTASFIPGSLFSSNISTFTFNLQLNDKLPTGASAQLAWTNQRNRSNSFGINFNPNYNTALTLTLTQPLLKNFGIDVNETPIKLAINNRQIARSTLTTRIYDVVTNTQGAYFDLVSAIEQLEVARQSLALARDLVDLNKARVRAGVAAPVEVTQAEATAAAQEGNVLTAEKAVKDAEDNLRVILNLPGSPAGWEGTIVPAERPAFQVVTVDLPESIRTALSKRSEYEAAKVDVANKDLNRRLAKNQLLPELDAVGSAGLTGLDGVVRTNRGATIVSAGGEGSSLGNMVSAQFNNWSAGLTLTVPLGNRAAEAGYTQAALQEDQSRVSLRNLELQITAQVREGVRRIETGAKQVEAARVARVLAEEQLRIETLRLRAGVSTTFNVTTFQTQLATARANEVTAVNTYQKALVNMERVRGTVLEKFQIQL
ncbi:MAG TPA: TolC family protein [Candidatus Sulfotelmatobacter sp.]|nr:TolC family protein [Candidatus Sulfotelmatobacter sp.]